MILKCLCISQLWLTICLLVKPPAEELLLIEVMFKANMYARLQEASQSRSWLDSLVKAVGCFVDLTGTKRVLVSCRSGTEGQVAFFMLHTRQVPQCGFVF